MTIRALINANPFFQAIKERDAFTATRRVTLQDWRQVQAASWWCEERWRDHGLHYRRRASAEDCVATFEFCDDGHAFEFLLRHGAKCFSL